MSAVPGQSHNFGNTHADSDIGRQNPGSGSIGIRLGLFGQGSESAPRLRVPSNADLVPFRGLGVTPSAISEFSRESRFAFAQTWGSTVMIFIPRLAARIAFAVAGFAAAGTAPVRAEGPVVVNPSRPGIPVVIDGCDASYAVVFGDWGLSRPGAAPARVIGCPPAAPNEVYRERNRYYPKSGHPPKLGRNEVEPAWDRELPKPAESFSRSWKKKKKKSSDVTAIKSPAAARVSKTNSRPKPPPKERI